MSQRSRQFAVVLAAQSICVCVGLWMQQQYVSRSAIEQGEENAWRTLGRAARAWQSSPESLDQKSSPRADAIAAQADQLTKDLRTAEAGILVADA